MENKNECDSNEYIELLSKDELQQLENEFGHVKGKNTKCNTNSVHVYIFSLAIIFGLRVENFSFSI